jgi:hypothetical protein
MELEAMMADLNDILNDLSIDRAWGHLEHITSAMPSRLAGSVNSRRMAEYAYEQLQANGLSAQMHEFLGLVSFPEPAEVQVLAPEQYAIEAHTLGHSATTTGIEGALVYVGSGAESEYEGKDVRGKITLSELSYTPARHEKAYIAWKRGSTAQIMMNWGTDDNPAVPFGSMKSAWGNPTPETIETEMPDLPCVGIARTEGMRLKAVVERGTVRVRVNAQADNGWRPLTMTSGEVAARERQFMLLGGHMDSWFGPQATDNAAGSACILELARVFAQRADDLPRGLMTGFWMGHETGTMISSTRFADVNWDRLRHDCIAYLQIDQPGMAGTSVWRVHSTDDIQSYAMDVADQVLGGMPLRWHRQQKNGDSSFFGVGLSCIAGEMGFTDEEIQQSALATLGWWHHSIHNTLDKVDKEQLALSLRVYATWVWGLLTRPLLPYDYRPLAGRFAERLSALAALDVPDIDMGAVAERAREFEGLAGELERQRATLAERADAGVDVTGEAEWLNAAMIQLSRILVPVASTAVGPYGQDRYGHVWQTQMIPALVPYPQLAGYARDSAQFQTWWVAQIRARNRVADALEQANVVTRRALDAIA